MLEMLVNVLNMDDHVLAYFVGAWRPKLGALAAQHDGAVGNVELRMGDAATRNRRAQAFLETEGVAEPVDRLGDVLLDQDRYHGCFRCRPVDHHSHLVVDEAPHARREADCSAARY